ncbi:ATP-dependent zinc protease [Ekhidna sp.]|uniref:ATP-dependent zinc protease family protein n=1 Tax=Ekhidna sp. TaxID=2608089 RepID=UPI003B59093C
MAKRVKQVIGRLDVIDLPDLGVQDIHAKIDTGAYRSSLHCKKVHAEHGVLYFTLHTDTGYQEYATKEWTQKIVKSSNGKAQKRYVIKTRMKIFGKNYMASISLTDRSEMKNPLLIGRKILTNKFIVDVSQKNLSYNQKKQN